MRVASWVLWPAPCRWVAHLGLSNLALLGTTLIAPAANKLCLRYCYHSIDWFKSTKSTCFQRRSSPVVSQIYAFLPLHRESRSFLIFRLLLRLYQTSRLMSPIQLVRWYPIFRLIQVIHWCFIFKIIEEDEDLCARFPGELCAHICVPTGGSSYRCECREGFKLLADGKTCQQATQYDR